MVIMSNDSVAEMHGQTKCIRSTIIGICYGSGIREIGWDGVDWIDLAQDRDQWRALVNTVMNFRIL
jgi:hypothetical protein